MVASSNCGGLVSYCLGMIVKNNVIADNIIYLTVAMSLRHSFYFLIRW
jgi:hypothetical protein